MSLDYIEEIARGVLVVDTGFLRPRFDAAYLLVNGGRAAFIDTGTNHAVPRLLGALADLGLERDAVDWVIPTHVHLDHAGGAGALMAELPAARLLVHPRGAPHLIDPSALYQGALAVYGQAEMDGSYGRLIGVDAARVVTSSDGMVIELGGRPLELIDTPGHARHHHCIWDAESRLWFSGDTFGSSCREFDVAGRPWVVPITPPTQFEPEPLKASVKRLMARRPAGVCMTHFGRVGDLDRLQGLLVEQIDAMIAIARQHVDAPERHALLKREVAALYRASLARHGVADTDAALKLLAMDVELNAQGLGLWIDRQRADHR